MLRRAAELVWGDAAVSELAAATALPAGLVADMIGMEIVPSIDGKALLVETTPLRPSVLDAESR
jgi:hypothetical protein